MLATYRVSIVYELNAKPMLASIGLASNPNQLNAEIHTDSNYCILLSRYYLWVPLNECQLNKPLMMA